MSLDEFDRDPIPFDDDGIEQGWAGEIANTATGLDDDVYATIDGIDNGRHRYGPCGWMPRGAATYPTAGDSCLVIFDDNGEPWIACWTPA